MQHGACLGLGLAALGTCDAEIFEEVKSIVFQDSAVAGEGAGIGVGLLFAGTATDFAEELLMMMRETQHEKVSRGLISSAQTDFAESLVISHQTDLPAGICWGKRLLCCLLSLLWNTKDRPIKHFLASMVYFRMAKVNCTESRNFFC